MPVIQVCRTVSEPVGLLVWLRLFQLFIVDMQQVKFPMRFKISGWICNRNLQHVLWATITWDVNSSRKSGGTTSTASPVLLLRFLVLKCRDIHSTGTEFISAVKYTVHCALYLSLQKRVLFQMRSYRYVHRNGVSLFKSKASYVAR